MINNFKCVIETLSKSNYEQIRPDKVFLSDRLILFILLSFI